MSQYIDPPSIYAHFPKDKPVPPRLIELLNWLQVSINDEAGWFPEFIGSSLDWYLRPIDISPYFGVFTRLGDGSQLAYWFYGECAPHNPPIVILGSEGQMGILAGSIEELVARLTSGKFPNAEWSQPISNFYLTGNVAWIESLIHWAEDVWGLTDMDRQHVTDSRPETQHPNLEEWMLCLEEKAFQSGENFMFCSGQLSQPPFGRGG